MGAVSAVTDFVGDVVDTAVDAVSDVGSFVDDAVNDVVPGGWYTVAAVAAPYAIPELGAALGATEAAGATGLSTLPESVLTAGEAFGTGAGTMATDAALAAGAGASGTAAADMAISGLGEVPWESLGDQVGDFPLEGSYGNPTAPGVQDAVQNLLDNNALQSLTGAPLETLGDQPGDFPTEGNYGNPTAPGVQDAVQNLLDYNAQYATPALSTTDALRMANQAKNFFLTGSPTGALATSGTGTTSSSGALPGSILDFTPHMTKGSQINLVGMPDFQETYTQTAPSGVAPSPQLENVQFAATGGLIQHFGDGGAPVSLDPRFTKGRKPSPSTFYGNLFPLTSPQVGMPVFRAKNGGEVVDHQPEFYSEGGLGTLKNRYVKGEGDGTSDSVPAMLANGEFVIPADVVSKLGNGSNDAGAGVLDKFLVAVRKHAQNHNPKKLPPDSKGPLAYLLEAKKKKA